MSIVKGIIGLAFIFMIGFLVSNNRKMILGRLKNIAIMLVVQLVLTFVLLNTSIGVTILGGISSFFSWLMAQGAAGVDFVFGGIQIQDGAFVFFLGVLMPLVFISALIGILHWTGILNFVIKWLGFLINKITGMGELESYFPAATFFLGSPQVFITVKDMIPKLTKAQLFTMSMGAMSTVSASMLGSYMEMVDGQYAVVAVFLNMFSGLIISAIVNPYAPEDQPIYQGVEETTVLAGGNHAEVVAIEDEDPIEHAFDNTEEEEKVPFFSMLSDYITDGFNLAMVIAAMVIGFISLITFLNSIFSAITGLTFTEVMGYIFSPVSWMIGVPSADVVQTGGVMATKLLTNEFAAMGQIQEFAGNMSVKAIAMMSTYVISFANFGTIGIISGAVKSISDIKGKEVAQFSLKLLFCSTLAALWSATIIGMFF